MKHLSILVVVVLLNVYNCLAQAPNIHWQRCLGGSGDDNATSIQRTADGGYIVAGSTKSNDGDVSGNHGGYDYWVVKLDAARNTQWQKCLGGSNDDNATAVQQTADGGYIVAGSTKSNDGDVGGNHGYIDYWIVKLNTTGSIQWKKCFGGSSNEYATSIQQTADGGYIVAGYTNSYSYNSNDGDVSGNHSSYRNDYWIVKLNATGNIQWQKCLGGSTDDCATSIQQTADGGYIVAGYTDSYSYPYDDGDVSGNHNSSDDYWIVKLNSTGSIQWKKCLGGIYDDQATAIKQTADGGYIIVGFTGSNDGDVSGNHSINSGDYWVVKLNTTGNIQWQKCLGGTRYDNATSIQQTVDGGYIVAGNTDSNDGDVSGNHSNYRNDYWVVKLTATGNIQWQKCLGGLFTDYATSIQQTAEGEYIVAGNTDSNDGDVSGRHGLYSNYDFWVVKLYTNKIIQTVLQWDNSFPAQTASVKGVAADGTSRLYLKVSKTNTASTAAFQNVTVNLDYSLPNFIGKLLPATNITSYSIEANNASAISASSSNVVNGSVWFWYIAPDDFSANSLSMWKDSTERTVIVHIAATFSDGIKDSMDFPIKIVRPPLVMVHGLGGSSGTWNNFNYGSGTKFINSPLFKQKKAVNLSPKDAYDRNAFALLSPDATIFSQNRLNTLQGNIEELRKQGYACNQVDYICHSMGGCVLRTAINVYANKYYGTSGPYKNYGKGFVHKAITINTPHNNSPLADAITEFIPQIPAFANVALKAWHAVSPENMIFNYVELNSSDIWQATAAVKNLQVSEQAGGINLAATNLKYHLIAGDVDSNPNASAATAEYTAYIYLLNYALQTIRDHSSDPTRVILDDFIALGGGIASAFAFIEWYSTQKGFPNFLSDGDLVVPLSSQLAGFSAIPLPNNVTVFHNSSFLNANHIKIKDRNDVGNRIMNLLNGVVSSFFGNVIPATPGIPNGRVTQQSPSFTSNRLQAEYFDTSKIVIVSPAINSSLFADSTNSVQIKLKDTTDLAYVSVSFQGKIYTSVNHSVLQSFTVKIDSFYLGSSNISATAVYDRSNTTDHYTDTVPVSVATNATLIGFTAKEDTNYIHREQPFYPNYTAGYTNYSAGIPANSPDFMVTVSNPAIVQYNTTQHAFYAVADTGTTNAIINYKGFKDTIAFVLLPNLYSGCTNRTTGNATLKSISNWSRSAIPATCDSVVVMPGHTLVIDSSMQIRSLYISAGATVSLADSTVRLQIGEADDGDKSFVNNGNLIINHGKIAINGSLQLMAGSNFTMSGGELVLDANTGYSSTSLPNGKNIFDVSGTLNNFSFTGGTLQIIDPPLWNSSQSINCSYNFGDSTTLKFGNGISQTASSNLNGFGGNLLPAKIGKLVLDAATPNNNRIFVNLNPLTVKSSVQVKSGNLVQKAPIQVVQ